MVVMFSLQLAFASCFFIYITILLNTFHLLTGQAYDVLSLIGFSFFQEYIFDMYSFFHASLRITFFTLHILSSSQLPMTKLFKNGALPLQTV